MAVRAVVVKGVVAVVAVETVQEHMVLVLMAVSLVDKVGSLAH